MSAYLPQYRVTVYASRVTDMTEATVLSPAAGAPHADQFKVITKQGVAGWLPYLAEAPRGRRGRIDARDRKTDTGTMSLRLIDKRTSTSNLERWVTAFVGDAAGIYNLMGLKVFVEESLDDGAAWAAFYTGRITDVALDGHSVMILQLRDMGEDLNQEIFVGTPHSSVSTYANRCPLLPRGLVKPYGLLPVESQFTATVVTVPGAGNVHSRIIRFATAGDHAPRIITPLYYAQQGVAGAMIAIINDGGTEKWYDIHQIIGAWEWHVTLETQRTGVLAGNACVKEIGIDIAYAGTDPRFAVAFPVNSTVTCYVIPGSALPVSKDLPLFINDVHGVQLWKDILDGKYGPLDKTTGAPRRPVGYDASIFTTLIADTSFPMLRFALDGKEKLNEFVEDEICKPLNLGYYLNASGLVVPVDMRRKASPGLVSTIVDADRVEDTAVEWNQSRDDAITRMDTTFYVEHQETLDKNNLAKAQNQARLKETDLKVIKLNLGQRTLDIGDKPLNIDARGLRAMAGERMADMTDRIDYLKRYLSGLIDNYWGPFTNGAQYITLVCRRTANTNSAKPGTLHTIDIDPVPDPATNRRGGPRIARCIERYENGLQVELGFLDLGMSANATVPVFTAFVKDTGNPRHGVQITFTINAAADPVHVEFAIAGTVPVEASPLWQTVDIYTTGGTKSIGGLPVGAIVWIRIRSLPSGDDALQQPSIWVVSGTSITLDPMAVLSALSVFSITQSTADVTWTVTDTDSEIEVLLTTGAAPGTWTDDQIVEILPANTRSYQLRNLDGPTIQHTLGVRHRDPISGVGPVVTSTFSTTASPPTAPRPAGLATRNY